MKIYIASDHAGFELKAKLIQFLQLRHIEVEDMGPAAYDEQDDYPDTIAPLAKKVAADKDSLGIAIGGSGQGEAIVCNRLPGVRAAVYYGGDVSVVPLTRRHNNANVLSLGSRFVTEEEAREATELFLETQFSGEERHIRRITKLH